MTAVGKSPRVRNFSATELTDWIRRARTRTLELITDLSDEQLLGPRLATVNPLLWEIGHLAWFQEKWVLRDGGRLPSVRDDADSLYDSMAIAHDTRWDLLLPTRQPGPARTLGNLGRLAPCLSGSYIVLRDPDGDLRRANDGEDTTRVPG